MAYLRAAELSASDVACLVASRSRYFQRKVWTLLASFSCRLHQSTAGRRGAALITYLTTDPQALGVLAWVSTAITLLGFAIAIWQIRKVKGAADAARDASLGVARRVRSRELLAQLANADNHLRVGQAHLVSGRRDIVSLCLELSRGSVVEARHLSHGVAGDWTGLQILVIRIREVEGHLAEMTEPLNDDPGFTRLSLLLRDLSEGLQGNLAQARYAYDLDEARNDIAD